MQTSPSEPFARVPGHTTWDSLESKRFGQFCEASLWRQPAANTRNLVWKAGFSTASGIFITMPQEFDSKANAEAVIAIAAPCETDIMMPFSADWMRENGFKAWRCLADGTVLGVSQMLLNNGRLHVDPTETYPGDAFCYASLAQAFAWMLAFNPEEQQEPLGWTRHPGSGRRREGGDPNMEVVYR